MRACSGKIMPGRVVTAVAKPSSAASANSRGPAGSRIAIGIGEMPAGLPELAAPAAAALGHFRAGRCRQAAARRGCVIEWAPIVTSVAARALADPLPVEADGFRPARADRPSGASRRARDAPRISRSRRRRAKASRALRTRAFFGVVRRQQDKAIPSSSSSIASRTADRLLEFHPPQPRGAIGEAGRDVERRRGVVALQRGQHMVEQVAIAVVEGQRGEGPAFAAGQPRHGFVERDDLQSRFAQAGQDGVEEIRRDLQQGVGREIAALRRPDAMKGQDDAAAAKEIAPEAMQARGAKQAEPGRDQLFFQFIPAKTLPL